MTGVCEFTLTGEKQQLRLYITITYCTNIYLRNVVWVVSVFTVCDLRERRMG